MTDKPRLDDVKLVITGFGPFPGVPDNASSDLALAVTGNIDAMPGPDGRRIAATSAILDVDWSGIGPALETLYAQQAPTLCVHFGVSDRVAGFALERFAHNACEAAPDACGCRPSSDVLSPQAGERLESALPVEILVSKLAAAKITVTPSENAGRYLCNAAYFHSLLRAAQQSPTCAALFVHLSTKLHPGDARWPDVVDTGAAICLAALDVHHAKAL